ncbi:MAG: copper chaperone PCu(A)C [Moraxellaceae bacterium]|nr:copper chaperone PCu(A)C [Moraxellaceae bacterium]
MGFKRGMWMLVMLLPLSVQAAGNNDAPPVQVMSAWVPEPPSVSRNAAAYVTVLGGGQDDILLGASSPVAEVVELHETSVAGGVLRMRPVAALPVSARQRIEFSPGGLHFMLINLNKPLRVGEKVPLELRFEKSGRIRTEAEVRSLPPTPAAGAGDMHHHSHH